MNLEKNCIILYFFPDKLSHYKIYDFRKFLIPDAFKHVRLKNAFNRCEGHQILPLTVDYACFLVQCINYQNVICIQILQDSYKKCISCKIQETQLLQKIFQEMRKCFKIVARIFRD